MWWELLIGICSSSVLIFAIAWLTKSIIIHFLSKDIETYKIRLKAEVDKSLIEHDEIFRRLHSKRAEIIAELYAKLSETMSATSSFLSIMEFAGEPNKNEKSKIAMEKIMDFSKYFDKQRIFLSESLCIKIVKFINEIRDSAIDFLVYMDVPEYDIETSKQKREVWVKAWKKISGKEISEIRKELENEFRKILGVDNN